MNRLSAWLRPDLRNDRIVAGVAAGALALTLVPFLRLLPLGQWQPDEFIELHDLARGGLHQVLIRVTGWSPRPASELLLWAYAGLVQLTDRPLVVPFLAACWGGLLAAMYVAARGRDRRPALVSLALMVAFLVLARPGEMFYWPAAAAAYVTGLAALAVACLTRSMVVEAVALVLAAWCNETAATAVLIDALLRLAAPLRHRRIGRDAPVALLAGGAAAGVIWVVVTNRLGSGFELQHPPGGTGGNVLLSLERGVPEFLLQTIGLHAGQSVALLAAGLALKLMLLLGLRPGLAEGAVTRPGGVRRGIAFLLAAAASLVLAYRQFGYDCCDRHTTFRSGLTVLALLCFAQAWPTRLPGRVRAVLLAVPLLLLLAVLWPRLKSDRTLVAPMVAAREANWASGHAPGPSMTWRNGPVSWLANGWLLPAGQYHRSSDTDPGALDWRPFSVMLFFGKTDMVVLPP